MACASACAWFFFWISIISSDTVFATSMYLSVHLSLRARSPIQSPISLVLALTHKHKNMRLRHVPAVCAKMAQRQSVTTHKGVPCIYAAVAYRAQLGVTANRRGKTSPVVFANT